MTVINLHIGADAAHIVTDMGVVDYATGIIVGLAHKVIWLPRINAALAISGGVNASEYMRGYFYSRPPETPGDAEYGMRTYLEEAIERRGSAGIDPLGEFVLMIAGCDDGRPFGTTCVVSDLAGGAQVAIFAGDFALPPMPQLPPVSAYDADFMASALDLITKQRDTPAELPGGAMGRVASGAAILTTLRPDSINSTVLTAWPDRVGDSVKPDHVPLITTPST
ncbi:hypothetical protein [Devosia sp. Root635]|uniref:hypothetical protein n=1 Tax=Devosia sp. Root635 TaxID=1736575 RepID=UPI0007016842|nr:hypothetical protein [Devosia sp. Root635]KRA42061.1 hypothetical protein ASD80_10060 [Devosia sp. Root635]